MKISGLDALTRQLDEAQQALQELDGELGVVSFDPSDPASIEAAIAEVEIVIDSKTSRWRSNALVMQLTEQMKAQYRQTIIDRAASARLEASEDEG